MVNSLTSQQRKIQKEVQQQEKDYFMITIPKPETHCHYVCDSQQGY